MQIFFPYPQTPESAKRLIRSNGLSVAGIARALNVDRGVVNALLDGSTRGLRGQSHIAAIALGIKDKPPYPFTVTVPSPKIIFQETDENTGTDADTGVHIEANTDTDADTDTGNTDKTPPCPEPTPTLQPTGDQA